MSAEPRPSSAATRSRAGSSSIAPGAGEAARRERPAARPAERRRSSSRARSARAARTARRRRRSRSARPSRTPGWQVRVVPNLYPAFERQEVVVHSPRHARSLAELDDERARRSSRRRGGCGRGARERAGVPARARQRGPRGGREPAAHALAARLAPGGAAAAAAERASRAGSARRSRASCRGRRASSPSATASSLLCPWAGRLPYELLIAPARARGGRASTSALLGRGARAAADGAPPPARASRGRAR